MMKRSQILPRYSSPPTITTLSPLPSATVGSHYSTTIAASGGFPPYTWAITIDTPDTGSWLTINAATGVLSGLPGTAETESLTVVVTDSMGLPSPPASFTLTVVASAGISVVWANDGADKVTQDELRATASPSAVINTCWDGTTIKQFGAMNEVVSFNVILEAAISGSPSASVTLSNLVGPGGATIRSVQRTVGNEFNWAGTECELFYVRYLFIGGLSVQAYGGLTGGGYEPQVNSKLRLPLVGGVYTGLYVNRPNANKYYPDIAVPIERVPTFSIAAANNQSIWADIYIPKAIGAGVYSGFVRVSEGGIVTHTIPVSLTVRNFTLPDAPTIPTMMTSSYGEVSQRYTGVEFPAQGSANDLAAVKALQNQRFLLHRHKHSPIGEDEAFSGYASHTTQPSANYIPYLTGSQYTSLNGYAGPGTFSGQGVYSIMTFGYNATAAWPDTQTGWWTNTNGWETWFEANYPACQRFVYLADESAFYAKLNDWAAQLAANPGVGANLASLATVSAVVNVAWSAATAYAVGKVVSSGGTLYRCIIANTNQVPPNANWSVYSPAGSSGTITASYNPITLLEPSVNYWVSAASGLTSAWNSAIATMQGESGHQTWRYNGGRPWSPTMHIEEPGTDPRAQLWACWKKGISRYFYWDITYYDDFSNGRGNTNVFVEPRTFQAGPGDTLKGLFGNNGDGLLVYPGNDAIFPANSYGMTGPIASLRLKHLRRGVQDADYIALANAINPSAVSTIVNGIVPSVYWEVAVHDPSDPTYYENTPVSWSEDPGTFEAARLSLANIIEGSLAADPFPRTRWQAIQPSSAYNTSGFWTNAAKFNIVDCGPYMGIEQNIGATFASIFATIKSNSIANGFLTPTRCLHYTNSWAVSFVGQGGNASTNTQWSADVQNANWWLRTSYPGGSTIASPLDGATTGVLAITSDNAVTYQPTGASVPLTIGQGYWYHYDGVLRLGNAVSQGYSSGVALAANPHLDGYQIDNVFCETRVAGSYTMNGTSQGAGNATANALNQQGQAAQVAAIKATNPNLLIMGNCDYFIHSTTVFSSQAVLDPSQVGLFDMVYCQAAIGAGGIEGQGATTTAQLMANFIAAEAQMAPSGTLIFEQTGATHGAGFSSASQGSWTTADWQAARFGLACACMRNYHFALNDNENYSPSSPYFMDEYLAQGGKFGWLGPASSADAPQTAARTSGVWYRVFAGGVVFMNPAGNGTQTITLASLGLSGLSAITHNGFGDATINTGLAVTSITLQARDGRFLIG